MHMSQLLLIMPGAYAMQYLHVDAVEGPCINVIALMRTRRCFNGDLGAVYHTKDIRNACGNISRVRPC